MAIGEYNDSDHAEDTEGLEIGEYGYKYRMLEGVMMPPYITPARYRLSRELPTRPEDVCFTSYPKSGSTWLSYILLLVLGDGEVDPDKTLRESLHWIASSWPNPRSRRELEALPSPRIFKSHMPVQMAFGGDPGEANFRHVYIARNPKDVCLSYYHFETGKAWSGKFQPPWQRWLEMFLEGKLQRGSWFDHVLGWWALRDAENVHFMTFEELLREPIREIERLATFLEHPVSAELAESIRDRTAFETMKSDRFSNLSEIAELGDFFRKGKVGSWKEQFTASQTEAFDRAIAEKLGPRSLSFHYE